MPARPFWTPITRDVVTVEGPDALSYLHGQISQDIRNLGVGESTYTFVLEPTGKIDALARVTRVGEESYRLDTEAGYGTALLARINKFRIRVKAETALTSDVPVIAVRGGDGPDGSDAAVGVRVSAWGLTDAHDLFGGEPPAGVTEADTLALLRARIEAGWPAMGTELTEASIPAESAITQHAVSFTKGCYPGQELVERMDSRGASAPRIVRRLRGTGRPGPGAEVTRDGVAVGHLTSIADDGAGGWVALALVARSVQPGDAVDVAGSPSTAEAL